MFKQSLISALLLTGISGSALAAGLDYDTLDIGFQRYELDQDGDNFDVDGLNLQGSLKLTQDFFLRGGIEDVDGSDGPFRLDARTYSVGLGVRAPINNALDFNAYADYLYTDTDYKVRGVYSDSDNDSGYRVGGGLRGLATSDLELAGFVNYEDYGHGDDSTWLDGRAVYSLTPSVGLYGGYGVNLDESDLDRWSAGVRVSF